MIIGEANEALKGTMRDLKVATRGLNTISITQRIKERVKIRKGASMMALMNKKKIHVTERSISMAETVLTGNQIISIKRIADKVREIVLGITMQAKVKVEKGVTIVTKELHKALLQEVGRNLSPKPRRGNIKTLMARVQNLSRIRSVKR